MERKRTITWEEPVFNAKKAAAISGLDYLRSIKEERISLPPIARLVGYKMLEIKNGLAVFEL